MGDDSVAQLDIDLDEIQSLDAQEIIRHKLNEGLQKVTQLQDGDMLIVEDTSLYLGCLNDQLPGPFIKWFLKSLSLQDISNLTKPSGNTSAFGVTLIGLAQKDGTITFFEGRQDGVIVDPRGVKDFGWGPIFQPTGSTKTYGEMEREEKHAQSMRGEAIRKLKEFLK